MCKSSENISLNVQYFQKVTIMCVIIQHILHLGIFIAIIKFLYLINYLFINKIIIFYFIFNYNCSLNKTYFILKKKNVLCKHAVNIYACILIDICKTCLLKLIEREKLREYWYCMCVHVLCVFIE